MRPAERTRKTARKIAALLPPLRRMLVDRDDLRRKNIELQQEVGRLAHELKAAPRQVPYIMAAATGPLGPAGPLLLTHSCRQGSQDQ